MVQAFNKRTEMSQSLLAWHAAHTINIHLPRGKRVTWEKLMGRKTQANAGQFMDASDFKAHLDARQAELLAEMD